MGDEPLQDTPQEEGGGQLPFHPRTLVIGLIRHMWIPVCLAVIGVMVALPVGRCLGSRVYQAETVMLYKPLNEEEADPEATPSLFTQLSLVETQPNLEEVRRRLDLHASLKQIAAACEVTVQRKTTLMIIRSRWNTPEETAGLANTLRDVFITNQRNVRKNKAVEQTHDLEARVAAVDAQLQVAEDALEAFTVEHRVVDLSQEAQWLLEELTSLELLIAQAQIEKQTVELQMKNMEGIIEDLRVRVAKEKVTSSSEMEGQSILTARIERLSEKIVEDKRYRANQALLVDKELDLARKRQLREEDIISESEYQSAVADYERQKAITEDTDEIKRWRSEIAELDKAVLPSESENVTQTGRLMYDMMVRSFDIQLQAVAVSERVSSLEGARARTEAKLARMPELQRRHATLEREMTLRESEKKQLERMLGRVRRMSESEASAFSTVSEARVPTRPYKSNRKKITLGVTFLFVMIGGAITVGLEGLGMLKIRSSGEAALKFDRPVLGVIPCGERDDRLLPDEAGSPVTERFRLIARKLRYAVPRSGARILVLSAVESEGATIVAVNLAAALGRQDERVLLVDPHVRPREPLHDDAAWIASDGLPDRHLGDYLLDAEVALDRVVQSTRLEGVYCVPAPHAPVSPDLLACGRMGRLFEEAGERFDVVLADSPSALPYGDALSLARWADAIVWVARAHATGVGTIRKALDLMEPTGVPIVGVVLNGVSHCYLENDER